VCAGGQAPKGQQRNGHDKSECCYDASLSSAECDAAMADATHIPDATDGVQPAATLWWAGWAARAVAHASPPHAAAQQAATTYQQPVQPV